MQFIKTEDTLTKGQLAIIAKMWIPSLLEAIGDSYMEEPGINAMLTANEMKILHTEIIKHVMRIRHPWPKRTSISDIINYLTAPATEPAEDE